MSRLKNSVEIEKKKILIFLTIGLLCFLLIVFDLLSFNVVLKNGVRIELLYVPVFISAILLLLLAFEKLLNIFFRKK